MVFRYKDYWDHNKPKVMLLSRVEFIRRFLLHILPKEFMCLRHYGFLANRCRTEALKQVRAVQAQGSAAPATPVDVMSVRHLPVTHFLNATSAWFT